MREKNKNLRRLPFGCSPSAAIYLGWSVL